MKSAKLIVAAAILISMAVTEPVVAFGAQAIFVSNDINTVTVYPRGSKGAIQPIAQIRGRKTGLNSPFAITRNSRGSLYVANASGGQCGNGSVTVYRPGGHGNVAPVSTIAASYDPTNSSCTDNTGLNFPDAIAVDSTGKIYVANFFGPSAGGRITIFSAGSNGNVAPIAEIGGSNSNDDNTGLNSPEGIVLDSNGNIFVANQYGGPDGFGSVTVYPAGTNGNVPPSAIISDDPGCAPCDNTGLANPDGIVLDSSGNIYVANCGADCNGFATGSDSITVYSPRSNGNVAPIATISGTDTGLATLFGIALDNRGNIYAVNWAGGPTTYGSVTVYTAGSNGNVNPKATITGYRTGLNFPIGVTIGPVGP